MDEYINNVDGLMMDVWGYSDIRKTKEFFDDRKDEHDGFFYYALRLEEFVWH